MSQPTYAAIQQHSPLKPVLIFVSSRRQTRLTALDLISFIAADDNPKQWVHMSDMALESSFRLRVPFPSPASHLMEFVGIGGYP